MQKKMQKGGKVQQNEVRFLSNNSNKGPRDISDFLHGLSQDISFTPFATFKTKGKA